MRFLLLAAFFTVAAPAMAQDGSETAEKRTVEGAQKFLVDHYAGKVEQAVTANARISANGWELVPSNIQGDTIPVISTLVAIESAGRCKTRLTLRNFRKYTFGYPLPQALDNFPASMIATIDWSRVAEAGTGRRREHVPAINTTDDVGWRASAYPYFSFFHPTEEEAKRVAFAMTFLRDQCSKSETGF